MSDGMKKWKPISERETRAGSPLNAPLYVTSFTWRFMKLALMVLCVYAIFHLDEIKGGLWWLPVMIGAWSAIAAGETDANSPLNQTLMDKIRGNLDYNKTKTDLYVGVMGKIIIVPTDFMSDDAANPVRIVASASGSASAVANATPIFVTKHIPTGYKATHVMIYCGAANAVNTYQTNLSSGATTASKGSGNANTEIDITDITGGDTVGIVIDCTNAASNWYGGYITLAEA